MQPEEKSGNILEALTRLRHQNSIYPFKFAGQLLFAVGRHVLYWPAKNLLIVSDLHFGKGQSLNRYGNFIPTFDTTATLQNLGQVITDYAPNHVLALGDSFHDRLSGESMSASDAKQLIRLCESTDHWTWILGNHDEQINRLWPGEYCVSLELEGIHFCHEPEADLTHQIVGHFHPKHTARLKDVKATGRCFVKSNSTLIMPSFGSYTGGLSVENEAIMEVLDHQITGLFLCFQQQIFSVKPEFS